MIYITQLIYLKEGKEAVFEAFEKVAIPSIGRYRGKLLLRIRPDREAYLESQIEAPYEVHLAAFETEIDFQAFLKDEERQRFLHLKEESIRSSLMIRGTPL
ncbi:MAG TPA: DUF1330 domain-containing protein [Flavisolibacter sp.]|jgi:hypothetical protein|nr:DUF1330 domain-containing protein [Flavisolibacter sp.]